MKKSFKFLFIIPFILIFSGCATMINQTKNLGLKDYRCAVVPFVNYSETPLAGSRVASILYGVLKSKGYSVDLVTENATAENLKRKGYACVISGFVNEWRYKVGIDGEPAVSVTYVVKNLKTGSKISSGTLSATEWGNKSLGLLTQELFDRAF